VRLLLDTNALVRWHLVKLRPAAVRTVQRAELVVVSAVSAWEIAVKRALGKLDLKDTVEQIVARYGFLACRRRYDTAICCAIYRCITPIPSTGCSSCRRWTKGSRS